MIIHAFVDGAYLRGMGRDRSPQVLYPDPVIIAGNAIGASNIRIDSSALRRLTYFDALPELIPGADPITDLKAAEALNLEAYCRHIELMNDCQLGFGVLRRGARKQRQQKGVDTLIAVEMLVGAFNQLYDWAVLIAGDADFVPVLAEVKRRGANVIVASTERGLSDDLRRAADRVWLMKTDSVHPLSNFTPPYPGT